MTRFNPTKFVVDLLSEQTTRDRQHLVGASNISSPCTRCLADDLLGVPQERGKYFLGAVIGTAIHSLLEERLVPLVQADEALSEYRVTIGEIPGYGVITSVTDLYLPWEHAGIDFKTTTKAKLKFLKEAHTTEYNEYEISKVTEARFSVLRYNSQLKLYGLGMYNAGYDVKWLAPAYIARDGLTAEPDCIWAPPMLEFDVDEAKAIFDRAVRLWNWLEDGNDPDLLSSHEQCYSCNTQR